MDGSERVRKGGDKVNVGSLLKNSALRFPDRVALVAGERRLSYREYNRRANKLANRLVRLGVKKGEKVSLYLHNSIEWAEIYWALSKIGAVVVPVNFRIKGEELVHVVGNSETGLFFFDDTLREQVEGIKERLKEVRQFIMVGKSPAEWYTLYDALFEESSAEEPGVRVSEKDVHSICYTSGTTGFPKGAVLTNMNVLTSHFLINPG